MTDNRKILEAIQAQRWFFFENNNEILFDRDTALIWANLEHFPYGKNGNSDIYRPDEISSLIKSINKQSFGGFSGWRVPNPIELWRLVEDKTFPFKKGDYWRINYCWPWCIDYNGKLSCKDLDSCGAVINISTNQSTYVIPCSSALVPNNFIETSLKVFKIFKDNKLIPRFIDAAITELYKETVYPGTTLEPVPTPEPEPKPEPKTPGKIDYLPILAKYDLNALATSPIKYYKAVSSVADTFLDVLQDYETQNSEAISEFSQAALTLGAKYTQNPNLTDEENNLLEERQKFLSRKLEAGTDDVKEQILSLKEQAKLFFDRLDEINHGKNSICELAALEAEPRASFAFLVENTANIVQSAQDKLNFFILHKDLVSQIVAAWETCSDDYKTFKTNRHEELITLCRADEVESEIFDAWYDDWQTKRLAMERRLLPLIEFALKGNLLPQDDKPSAFEEVLKTLRDYRDAVDKFYLHERKNIYQKFAFTAGGDLQEKFETESELYKRTEIFQREVQKIIFACDKTEERIFLLKWAEPLLNLSVDAITDFIRERELDSISEKILNQFAALRRQNLMSYLADSAAFSKALQQREKDYNQLMFRMRKGLSK